MSNLSVKVTRVTLNNFSPSHELLRAVLAIDPNAPSPLLPQRAADLNIVPELPASTKLTEAQLQEAVGVGQWLTDYIQWAGSAANETPLAFHLGAGLYLAAIAVGRRLYIPRGGSRCSPTYT